MGMTIDDMYDWLYRLKSELVVYMPKEWHVPMICSIQDAITFSRKYQMLKADYENRLKADMVAILEDLDLQIDELSFSDEEPINITQDYIDEVRSWEYGKKGCKKLIQQKIDALKAESEEV